MLYGYCRVSTPKQSIERQIRNIKSEYPNAVIIQEAHTGTKVTRPQWSKLYKRLQSGDVVVFDSVSRMSRTATDGFKLYKELSDKGVELVFLKEPHLNTSSYREAMNGIISNQITSGDTTTDELISAIMRAVNKFMLAKVESDILGAFEQAEKEVLDLHERTKEGIETARLNGKQIGQPRGTKLTTKKSIEAKKLIMKYNVHFGGSLNNEETYRLINISRNTFYRYLSELQAE